MGVEWHRSLLHIVEESRKKGIVFYGAGYWGEVAYELFSLFKVTPVCYCDDNPKKVGTIFCDTPVCSLEEATERYNESLYIVCVDESPGEGMVNHKRRLQMINKLKEYGVYTADTEMHLCYYVFLLDIGIESIYEDLEKKEIREDQFSAEELKKIILFNNMSNSGAYYLEQLLDGHSELLFLPYIESLERVWEKRLQYLEGPELLVELMAQLLGYFESKYNHIWCVGQHRFKDFCTDEEGRFIEAIYQDGRSYMRNLRHQFGSQVKLSSYGHMLKVLFAAYNNTLGRRKDGNTEYWIFYHMHLPNYDVKKMYDHLHPEEFDRIENLIIIREPVQHLYSWIRRCLLKESNSAMEEAYLSNVLKSDFGIMLEKQPGIENVRIIKFEDLKYQSKATLNSLCEWLKISYEDCMDCTTINGTTIYFPVNTAEGKKYITGNDTLAVGIKDFSEIFSIWDEVRLNIVFGKMKRAYGYETSVPDFTEWSSVERKHILEERFKCSELIEKALVEKRGEANWYDVDKFIKEIMITYMEEYQEGTAYYGYIGEEKSKGEE